jgi:hypothetical protein
MGTLACKGMTRIPKCIHNFFWKHGCNVATLGGENISCVAYGPKVGAIWLEIRDLGQGK